MVVESPSALVSPQVVVRLQQCSYILVNDCRTNALLNRSNADGHQVLRGRKMEFVFDEENRTGPTLCEGRGQPCEFL